MVFLNFMLLVLFCLFMLVVGWNVMSWWFLFVFWLIVGWWVFIVLISCFRMFVVMFCRYVWWMFVIVVGIVVWSCLVRCNWLYVLVCGWFEVFVRRMLGVLSRFGRLSCFLMCMILVDVLGLMFGFWSCWLMLVFCVVLLDIGIRCVGLLLVLSCNCCCLLKGLLLKRVWLVCYCFCVVRNCWVIMFFLVLFLVCICWNFCVDSLRFVVVVIFVNWWNWDMGDWYGLLVWWLVGSVYRLLVVLFLLFWKMSLVWLMWWFDMILLNGRGGYFLSFGCYRWRVFWSFLVRCVMLLLGVCMIWFFYLLVWMFVVGIFIEIKKKVVWEMSCFGMVNRDGYEGGSV